MAHGGGSSHGVRVCGRYHVRRQMAQGRAAGSATAIAFAPGSVGNVAVGFDILGHSVSVVGDHVLAKRIPERIVRIAGIIGVTRNLPLEADRNTAGVAVQGLMDAAGLDHGFELTIRKGIPFGSGLGGSAASAVAAVVAANALLQEPADTIRLLKCAMHGEAVASGAAHVDNIAPSLVGGLVLTVGIDDPIVKQIPVPDLLRCVLVRPHMELQTRASRGVLQKTVLLSDVVWQEANLAGFLTGCFTGDLDLIRASFSDVMIEPQRKSLIPGFEAVKQAALASGALGCSISGGGPTMFAWCEETHAGGVRDAMVATFRANDLQSDAWIVSIVPEGARLVDRL
jgi:homoserine kinase